MKDLEPYLHPSPVIKVLSDKMIFECIQLMKVMNVGSILVTSSDGKDNLVGIFTERDLLTKFDFIQNYENLKLPINRVMTSPLKTLELSELDSAPEFMLKNRIRHLPVVVKNSEGISTLVGVVSMRDVLKRLLQGPAVKSEKPKKNHLILYSGDNHFVSLVKRICSAEVDLLVASTYSQLELILAGIKKGLVEGASTKAIVDIEHSSNESWAKAARLVNSDPGTASIMFTFNSMEKNKTAMDILNELNKSDKILVLSKPVNILALSDFIARNAGEFVNLSKAKWAHTTV
jgi:CBS domain-containing protein